MIRFFNARCQDRLAHGRDWWQWGATTLLFCSEIVLLVAVLTEGYALIKAVGAPDNP
jgi:hypothetical protein